MPDILLPTGEKLPPEKVKRAYFWEAGADFEGHIVGEAHVKAEEDTLRLQMKDPKDQRSDIKGTHARKLAAALRDAGVAVFWHRKK